MAWITFALPLAISIGLVLAVGPILQHSVFSAISNDAPDIYSSLPPELSWLPNTLTKWLEYSFSFYFFCLGVLVVFISMRAQKLKSFLAYIFTSSFAVLTIVDIFNIIVQKMDVRFVFENIVANLVGCLVLAIFALTALLLFKGVIRLVHEVPKFGRFLAGFCVVIYGLLVSSSSFYGLRAVYQTVAMPVDLIATPPFSGYISPSTLTDDSLNSLATPSDPATSEQKSWGTATPKNSIQMRGVEGRLNLKWTVVPDNNPFTLEIRLYKNCQYLHRSENLPATKPNYKQEVLSKMTIDTNEGVATFFASFLGQSTIQHSPDVASFYWSESNTKTKIPVQTFFSSKKSSNLAKSEGEIELRVAVPPILPIASPTPAAPTRSQLILQERNILLNLDGRRLDIHVSAKPNEDQKPTLGKCAAVEQPVSLLGDPPKALEIATGENGVLIVFLLKPTKVEKLSSRTYGIASSTEFSGLLGDVEFNGPSFANTVGAYTKRISVFSIEGNVQNLVFANNNVSIESDDDIAIRGEVVISSTKNGGLRVQGQSTKVWKNGRRLNLTRWERIGEGYKIALVTALLSMFGAVAFNFRKASPEFWTGKLSLD